MSIYCNSCAVALGLDAPCFDVYVTNFTGSQYQLEKFKDHTVLGSRIGSVSLLDDGSYENYSDLMTRTFVSGAIEVDAKDRYNYIYCNSGNIGRFYDPNTSNQGYPEKWFKAVKYDTEDKTHGFSFEPKHFTTTLSRCSNCQIALYQ